MSFHKSLERLEAAAARPKSGVEDLVKVRRADLRELLHHFDRLDTAARADYNEAAGYRKLAADRRELLKKYMAGVIDKEGVSFIEYMPHLPPEYALYAPPTPAEIAELNGIEAELREEVTQ